MFDNVHLGIQIHAQERGQQRREWQRAATCPTCPLHRPQQPRPNWLHHRQHVRSGRKALRRRKRLRQIRRALRRPQSSQPATRSLSRTNPSRNRGPSLSLSLQPPQPRLLCLKRRQSPELGWARHQLPTRRLRPRLRSLSTRYRYRPACVNPRMFHACKHHV